MKVLFNDVKAAHVAIASELDAAIQRVLRSGRFILGQELETFEAEFAAYCGVKHCVGVASGTEALQLALLACGIGPDDEVITVAHTAMPTALAIAATGATPVFVDIDPQTYTLRPDQLEEALSPKTRAIVPVHLYGHCADMGAILEFAARQKLCVIEDAAQAHGSTYNGRKAGSMGHMGCFSFYPSKNLGACGDGGAIVTADAELAARLRRLRNYGESRKYRNEVMGYNSRLDELQAAVLRVKLPHLEQWNESRRNLAKCYETRLEKRFSPPTVKSGYVHSYHLFVIQSEERDKLQEHLRTQDIETLIHYPVPCHLQPAMQAIKHRCCDLSVTERLARRILSLPMFATLSSEQVEHVARCVNSFGAKAC
ncbi:MAG: DegT/DnrJ/EryC1/StrS family aminotransferase [Terracidiphilus sp.]|jgi:dTDP-4-amino-4,6-dideoxygalactose transaminase